MSNELSSFKKKVCIAGVITMLALIIAYASCLIDYNVDFNYLALKFALSSIILFGAGWWVLLRSKENNKDKLIKVFIVTCSMSLFCLFGFLFIRCEMMSCYFPKFVCMWWGESIWNYYMSPIITIIVVALAVLAVVNIVAAYFSKSIKVAIILCSCFFVGLSGITLYPLYNSQNSRIREANERTNNRFRDKDSFKTNVKRVRFKSDGASDKQGVIVRFSGDGSSVQTQVNGIISSYVPYDIYSTTDPEYGREVLFIETENYFVRFDPYNSTIATYIPRYGKYRAGEPVRLCIYPYVSDGFEFKWDDDYKGI